MALSPMARHVADVGTRQQAVQEAQQEAAACRERLHALHLQLASSLDCTEAQRQECTRVSIAHAHSVSLRSHRTAKPCQAYIVEMALRDSPWSFSRHLAGSLLPGDGACPLLSNHDEL